MKRLYATLIVIVLIVTFAVSAQDGNKTLHVDDGVTIDFDLKPKQSNTDKVELTFPVSNEARCFRLVGRAVDSIACPETDTLSKGCMEVDANGNLKISGCGTAACLTCDSSDVIFDRASETTFAGTKTFAGMKTKPALVGQDILDLYNKTTFDYPRPKLPPLSNVTCPEGTTLDGGIQFNYSYVSLECYTPEGVKSAYDWLFKVTKNTAMTVTGAKTLQDPTDFKKEEDDEK